MTSGNETAQHVCNGCGYTWDEEDLLEIQDLLERCDPGEPMPSGECPACGFLCHPKESVSPITSLHHARSTLGSVRTALEVETNGHRALQLSAKLAQAQNLIGDVLDSLEAVNNSN